MADSRQLANTGTDNVYTAGRWVKHNQTRYIRSPGSDGSLTSNSCSALFVFLDRRREHAVDISENHDANDLKIAAVVGGASGRTMYRVTHRRV